MVPFADIHCHLLAGLDDGPRTDADALRMCQVAWSEGTRIMAATAHISGQWPEATADRIRQATARLIEQLEEHNIMMRIVPSAEVTVTPDIVERYDRGELLSIGDRGNYLLLELPTGIFVDLRAIIQGLMQRDVRPILAHPERSSELLHDSSTMTELLRLGCLVQVTSDSIVSPPTTQDKRALKRWFQDGFVHFVASDGHSPRSRPPMMAEAYQVVSRWAGADVADRLCGINGLTVIEGRQLRPPAPKRRKFGWLSRFRRR